MTKPAVFILSIEPMDGPSFQHGFHLGTIESVARKFAEDMFFWRNNSGEATRTVALIRDRKLFDCYDGMWSSEYNED
jgi:hypothetical protein